MTLLITFVVLSISVSFLCSILEAALLSLTPSYIAQLREEQPKLHDQLAVLKERIDQPLAAILTLNTVAHTAGATGVGAQVMIVFGEGYLVIASVVMTLLILIVSEIYPKIIGARYWRQIAPWLPKILGAMIWVLKPFIWMSDRIMGMFGGHTHDLNIRDEIKALSILGRESDQLSDDEQRVIANIIDLREINVRDIMTPRVICNVLKPSMLVSDFVAQIKNENHSRYPVLDEEEEPLGILFRYDIIHADQDASINTLLKPVVVVPATMNVEQVMRKLMNERQHMALVYDEYGSWLGLVTMEDAIETILGKPILDETDEIPNMRRFARRRWRHKMRELGQDDS